MKTNELADNFFKTFTKNLRNMPIRNDNLDLSLITNLQSYGGDLEEEAENLIQRGEQTDIRLVFFKTRERY